uniref:J domain-containing protein n=1 Tax=Alexandrium catenella TaxID=2925 RepID=A0A7S1PK17_ALECA
MVERLVMASWGPLHSRPESGQHQQRPGFSIPKGPQKRPHWEKYFPGAGGFGGGNDAFRHFNPMEAMAKYLKNLELAMGASADDVKKSYKRLALKYHPDKNLGDTQEEASQRFREVQESYEVLCKFFEDHPEGFPHPKAAAPRPAAQRPQAAAPRPSGVPRPGPPGMPGQRPGFFPYARR